MVSAGYFFVGSEADIQGFSLLITFPYEGATPNEKAGCSRYGIMALSTRPAHDHPLFSDMDGACVTNSSDDEHIGAVLLD